MAGFIEPMEARTLLSGNVSASVNNGALFLRGDDAHNAIQIERGGATPADRTSLLLTPTDGTTLNGSDKPLLFRGIDAGMDIKLGAGADQLTLDNVRVYGAVRIDAGQGDDTILVRSSRTTGGLTMLGGGGEDQLIVRKSTIQGELDIDGGLGRDRFLLSLSHGRNRLVLSDTSGQSLLYLNHLSVDRAAQFRTGNSIDHVMIDSSTFKSDAGFATTGGDDQVKVRGTVFHGASPIDGGSGTNSIDRQVILSWDFRDGQQGWSAGFADYPAGQVIGTKVDGSPDPAEDVYELQSGLKPLPSELSVSGTGFFLSGHNHSDELSMYVVRRVSTLEGLLPAVNYEVTFRLRLASNEPAGLGGAGGPPAEAVSLHGYAVPQKAKLRVADGEENNTAIRNYTLQINYGGGAYLGNIANGGPPVPISTYRVITRKGDVPQPVTTDSRGQLSLLAGTFHSGFEGRTSLYYISISATLTPVSLPAEGGITVGS